MTCSGCSGAVTRVLTKLQGTYTDFCYKTPLYQARILIYDCNFHLGVDKFDVSLETQKVVVESATLSEVSRLVAGLPLAVDMKHPSTNQLFALFLLHMLLLGGDPCCHPEDRQGCQGCDRLSKNPRKQ